MAAVPYELSAKTSAFSTNASLFVRVHLPEYVWRERSVEIIGNTYAASPPAGRPFLANVAQGYETRDRTTGLRNDDFLIRLGAVDQLREAGLRLVDIDVFRHACSRGDPVSVSARAFDSRAAIAPRIPRARPQPPRFPGPR